MTEFIKHKIHLLILAALLILLVTLSLLSAGYYGGADNITHYLISHYSFSHPHLFLNAWGRPLYTILSAPFAQFGLQGVKLLNILLGLATAWFAFRIATMLKLKPAILSLVFVCFTPLYFMMMPTALTEILFSFVLVLSVFLFIRGNFIASALVISFLPFARTEGFILLPLFFLALLRAGKYKAIPFLAAGVLFFSILGAYYFKDLFWVFTQFPYPVTYHHPIYNKTGSLWHFLESLEYTLGLPLEMLFLTGIYGMVRDFFSKDKPILRQVHLVSILVLAPFLLYLAFHSVLFWKAMGGSMGLYRVLAAVMPLAALVALKGYETLERIIGRHRYIRGAFLAVILPAVVITPFMKNVIPYPLSPEEKTIKEAASWIRKSQYASRLTFYTDNNVPYYLGLDPYQKDPAGCYLFGDPKYLDTIPSGSILVWDAHFGANESKIPLDSLLGNQRQQLVNYFRPEKPWITFGGYNYECYITETLLPGRSADNYAIRDSIVEIMDAGNCIDTLFNQSFDNPGNGWDPNLLSGNIVHRGRCSFIMDGRTEFSPGLYMTAAAFPLRLVESSPEPISVTQRISRNDSSLQEKKPPVKNQPAGIRASAYVYIPEITTAANTLLVISFEHKNKPYSYTAINLNEQKLRQGRWNRICVSAPIPEFKSPEDLLKVYIWNPGKQVFYLDDMRVEVVR